MVSCYIDHDGYRIEEGKTLLKLFNYSMLYVYLVGCPYYRELKSLLNGQRVLEVCSVCVATILYSKIESKIVK